MSRHDAPHTGRLRWTPTVVVRRALRAAVPVLRGQFSEGAHAVRRSAVGPGPALLVVTGFLSGGVVGVTLDQMRAEALHVVQVEAADAAQARVARHDTAATERLSGQATAYFARRRSEALDAAQAAVTEAEQVRASVGPVVGVDALEPLDKALTTLSALVGTAPAAPIVLQTATATVAAQVPIPLPTLAPVSPTTPGADVLTLAAQVRSSQVDVITSGPGPVPSPAVGASLRDGRAAVPPADPRPAADTVVPKPTTPDPAAPAGGSVTPVAPPSVDSPAGSAASITAEESMTAPGTREHGPAAVDSLVGVFSRVVQVPPTIPAADVAAAAASGLDVTVSNEIIGLVAQIRALAAQAQASADAVVAEQLAQAQAKAAAEADARAAAQAAAQAAAERAVRSMRTRIAATDAAPNGQVPTILLCGVSFQANVLLRCDAAAMLDQMDAAYRAEVGHHLVISSSYRTSDEQEVLHTTKGDLAAPAGASNHGRGLAIDIAGAGDLAQFDTPIYLWLVAHAQTYGWHHPSSMEPGGAGPLEPWHWEFDTP